MRGNARTVSEDVNMLRQQSRSGATGRDCKMEPRTQREVVDVKMDLNGFGKPETERRGGMWKKQARNEPKRQNEKGMERDVNGKGGMRDVGTWQDGSDEREEKNRRVQL